MSYVTLQGGGSDAREMMRRFYALGGDRQPALALALAQRQLLPPIRRVPFVVYGGADADDCGFTMRPCAALPPVEPVPGSVRHAG